MFRWRFMAAIFVAAMVVRLLAPLAVLFVSPVQASETTYPIPGLEDHILLFTADDRATTDDLDLVGVLDLFTGEVKVTEWADMSYPPTMIATLGKGGQAWPAFIGGPHGITGANSIQVIDPATGDTVAGPSREAALVFPIAIERSRNVNMSVGSTSSPGVCHVRAFRGFGWHEDDAGFRGINFELPDNWRPTSALFDVPKREVVVFASTRVPGSPQAVVLESEPWLIRGVTFLDSDLSVQDIEIMPEIDVAVVTVDGSGGFRALRMHGSKDPSGWTALRSFAANAMRFCQWGGWATVYWQDHGALCSASVGADGTMALETRYVMPEGMYREPLVEPGYAAGYQFSVLRDDPSQFGGCAFATRIETGEHYEVVDLSPGSVLNPEGRRYWMPSCAVVRKR